MDKKNRAGLEAYPIIWKSQTLTPGTTITAPKLLGSRSSGRRSGFSLLSLLGFFGFFLLHHLGSRLRGISSRSGFFSHHNAGSNEQHGHQSSNKTLHEQPP